MINKVRAAGVTLLFFALVRPDSVPEMWVISILSILMYEAILMGLNTWTVLRAEKKQKEEEIQTYYHNKANGRRWEEATMGWKMKEVGR